MRSESVCCCGRMPSNGDYTNDLDSQTTGCCIIYEYVILYKSENRVTLKQPDNFSISSQWNLGKNMVRNAIQNVWRQRAAAVGHPAIGCRAN